MTPESITALERRALLYVCEDLDPVEAAEFEATLAADQEAREAVASAAGLLAALANGRGGPQRGFRRLVRRRLRHRASHREPARLWVAGLSGAVAAALAFIMLCKGPDLLDNRSSELVNPPAAPLAVVPDRVALNYADDSNRGSLERLADLALKEEQRRKKLDDLRQYHPAVWLKMPMMQ